MQSTQSPSQTSEVVSIQQLRGLAAMLVVFHHANLKLDWLFNPAAGLDFGMGGVDIFFVISGFVMFVAARHESASAFATKRIIRVVPLYWIATLLYFAMRLPHFGEPDNNLTLLLKSLFFVPYRVSADGPIWPMLIPGWTLNVEMFFYVLFAAGLALPWRRPAPFAAVAIGTVVLAGILFPPVSAPLTLLSSPLLLEFVYGLLLGWLWTRRQMPRRLWPLVPLGLCVLFGSVMFDAETTRGILRGIAGMLIVTGALSWEASAPLRSNVALRVLGDASYSIYLFHLPFLMILWKVFPRLPLHGWLQYGAFQISALFGAAIFGIMVFRLIERPSYRYLRAATAHRP